MSADRLRKIGHRLSAVGFLTELMHGLIIFTLLLLPIRLFASENTALLIFWIASAYLLFWLARMLLAHIWQYLVLSLVMIALPLMPLSGLSLALRLILLPAIMILAVRTFILRLTAKNDQSAGLLSTQALMILFFLIVNIVAVRLDLPEVSQAYFYMAIVYLLLTLLRWHTISLNEQMARFDRMPTQPAHRIRRFSQMLLIIFTILCLTVLLLAPFFHLHDFLPWLGSIALAALRWLLSLLNRENEPLPTEPEPAPTEMNPGEGLPVVPSEPALWLVVLQEIMYYLFIIISLLALLALLVYVFYRIYRRFYENQTGPDVAESLLPRLTEDIRERVRITRSRWRDNFGQSPEHKIRRLYFKTVLRLHQHGVRPRSQHSPRMFADMVRSQQDIDIMAMTYIYEKARYGDGACSDTEAKEMHYLYQNFRKSKINRKREE